MSGIQSSSLPSLRIGTKTLTPLHQGPSFEIILLPDGTQGPFYIPEPGGPITLHWVRTHSAFMREFFGIYAGTYTDSGVGSGIKVESPHRISIGCGIYYSIKPEATADFNRMYGEYLRTQWMRIRFVRLKPRRLGRTLQPACDSWRKNDSRIHKGADNVAV